MTECCSEDSGMNPSFLGQCTWKDKELIGVKTSNIKSCIHTCFNKYVKKKEEFDHLYFVIIKISNKRIFVATFKDDHW